MRAVSFFMLPAIGPGEIPGRGTLVDLLRSIPYLLVERIVPPLHVLNDLLRKGIVDAGMSGGCRWEPFQITRSEWEELLESLCANGSMQFVEPPPSVKTSDDWQVWTMTIRHGYPAELIELNRQCRELEDERATAVREGNQALVEELHVRVIAAGNRLAELMERHKAKMDT